MAAATVVGAFAVLDKASRPINKIRDAAIEAELAVKKLGLTLDEMSTEKDIRALSTTGEKIKQIGREADPASTSTDRLAKRLEAAGAPNLARSISSTGKSIENTGTQARGADRDVKGLTERMDVLGKKSDSSSSFIDKLAKSVVGLKVGLVAGLIPALGGAAQAIGALGAGAISLLPRLSDLAGLAGPAGVGMVGLGVGAITAKLAFSGLQLAMKGNAKALAELTPQGHAFLATLKLYKPVLQEVREAAQKGLFPGLDLAIRRAASAAPALSSVVQGSGAGIGGAVAKAVGDFTQPQPLRDFQTVAAGGTKAIVSLIDSFSGLSHVVMNFMVSALPFTEWLTGEVHHFSEWAERTSTVARETGRLQERFTRTQGTLKVFGDILKNVFVFLRDLTGAARSSGDVLWGSIDRITKRWADFAQSQRGQEGMQAYFEKMRPVMSEISHVVGDIGKALGSLTVGTGLTGFLHSIDEALPAVTQFLSATTAAFGPELGRLLKTALELFTQLGGASGPVMILVKSLNGVLEVINKIVKAVPGLGTALGIVFSVALFSRFLSGIRTAEGGLAGLAKSWLGVKAAADLATASEGRALAAAGAGAILPVGGVRARTSVGPSAFSQPAALAETESGAALMGLSGGLTRSGAGMSSGGLLGAGGLLGITSLLAGGKALPGMLAKGLGAAGRFLWPIMAIQGALGAIGSGGNVLEKAGGGVNAALFGLPGKLPGIGGFFQDVHPQGGQVEEEAKAAFLRSLATGQRTNIKTGGAFGEELPVGQDVIDRGFNRNTGAFTGKGVTASVAREEIAEQKERRGQLETQLPKASGSLKAALHGELLGVEEAIQKYEGRLHEMVEKSQAEGSAAAQGIGMGFSLYSKRFGVDKAVGLSVHEAITEMKKLTPEGRAQMGTALAAWAQEQARNEPKLRVPMEHFIQSLETGWDGLHEHIRIVNGLIVDDAGTQWARIRENIVNNAGKAEFIVKGTFSNIWKEVTAQLGLWGIKGAAASNIFQGLIHGGERAEHAEAAVQAHREGHPNAQRFQEIQANPWQSLNKGRARGGRLEGAGMQDTIPVTMGMAAPGELIVNRHTEDRVNQKLGVFGTSLGHEVERETRPHWMPMFRTGGRTGAAKGGTFLRGEAYPGPRGRLDEGVDYAGPGPVRAVAEGTVRSVGLWHGWPGTGGIVYSTPEGMVYVMEDFSPTRGMRAGVHVSEGQLLGQDTGGATGIETGWANAAGTGPLTPYGGAPDGTTMPGARSFARFLGGGEGPGTAPGGAGGPTPKISLHRIGATGPGVWGVFAQQAHNVVAKAAESQINTKLAQMFPGGMGGGEGAASGALVPGIMGIEEQAAKIAGLAFAPNIVHELLSKESAGGINEPASGALSATGPNQVIPATFASFALPSRRNINNPLDNAIASMRYVKATYGSLAAMASRTGLFGASYKGYAAGGRLQKRFEDVTAKLRTLWAAAQHLYPGAGQMPKPTYTSGQDGLFVGVDQSPGVSAGHRKLFVPDWIATQQKGEGPGLRQGNPELFALMLHEWAHEFQSKRALAAADRRAPRGLGGGGIDPAAEGGAEAFANLYGPSVVASAGFGHYTPEPGLYAPEVKWAKSKLGTGWIEKGQFGHAAGGRLPSYEATGIGPSFLPGGGPFSRSAPTPLAFPPKPHDVPDFYAFAHRVWDRLSSDRALPAHAHFPELVVGGEGTGAQGLAYTQNRVVHEPWKNVWAILHANRDPEFQSYKRQGLVHEFAHTMQRAGLRRPVETEGGAQSWADAEAPRVYGSGYRSTGDGNYAGYVATVRDKLGPDWIFHKQFAALGGRMPDWGGWNQKGGSGTFRRPTLLGVGDGHAPERVTITPHSDHAGARSGTRRSAHITFGPGSIVVHGADEKAAGKFVDHVMNKLADALEGMGLESEIGVAE